MTIPYIVCASITAISAIISLGFSVSAALSATDIARTMALRSVALVIASAVPFFTGSSGWLLAIAWSMIIVQTGDAVIGKTIKNPMKTYGFAGTVLLNLVAVIWPIQTI